MKIAIFGGSFNPVHNEHIKIVKSAISELKVDKLLVVPTYIAPHKKDEVVVSPKTKLKLVIMKLKNKA